MSNYETESQKQPSHEISKSLILSEIGLSRLESKLSMQRGTNTLNLSDCFIGDEGCQVVAKYLRENTLIHNLELRGNAITCIGVDILSSILSSKSYLKNVSLEWNNIGDNLGVFADALSRNNSIKNIDLRNNRIGPEGANHIAKIIENNLSIQKIDLRWNDIGLAGGRKILQALQRPHRVMTIDLSGNKIPEDLLNSIEMLLKGTETLVDEERIIKDERLSFRSNSPVRSERVTKESKYSDEIFSKYETQMMTNARHEARIKELEILLEQESRRNSEIKYELGRDVDIEKARRGASDENFLKFKEEALKREVEDARTIQELESKLNKALSEKNILLLEIDSSQNQLESFSRQSQERIEELEDKIIQQERQYRVLDESSKNNIERLKKQAEQEKYELLKDFQNKLNAADDNIKLLKNIKAEQDNDIKALNSQILSIKSMSEEAINNLEYSLRQESSQKYEEMVDNYEQRLKQVEETRDNLNKLSQELRNELINTEKKSSDQISSLESELISVNDEKNDINRQLQRALNTIENLRSELNSSRDENEKITIENDELNRSLKEHKDTFMQQIESLAFQHTQERDLLEDKIHDMTNIINKLEVDLNQLQRDKDRIIKEHEFLSETLKLKVSSLIQDSVISHMKNFESE
ncbi:hypothetical protein SteCoe_21806 [Stentor coeruleus]|uniref:Uncharacterized protein n=1 Tax=Stentor coeruleus TaxID=5963 RepID=A0A1R2BNP6_9CILI|nr:hypothetical protein SteCoe_21806 [Stentor coeruleus]